MPHVFACPWCWVSTTNLYVFELHLDMHVRSGDVLEVAA